MRLPLLMLCLWAAIARSNNSHPPSSPPYGPPTWPDNYHAVLFQNDSNILAIVDLWYDFPHGRNLNIIRPQLGRGGITWGLDWDNKTSVVFDREAQTCKAEQSDAGVLAPDWLANATNLGEEVLDGFVCNVWVSGRAWWRGW